MNLEVPIVNRKRNRNFTILFSAFTLSLIFLLISVFYLENTVDIIIAIILTLFSGLTINFIKSYSIIGKLILSDSEIIVILNNKKKEYPFNEISNFKLICYGFENESYFNPKSIGSLDGTDNFIEFRDKEIEYKFQILLTQNNYTKIKKFTNLISGNGECSR
jgi:hypothetical protein